MYIPTVVRYIYKRSSAELPLQGLDPSFLLFRFPLSVPSGLFVSDNLIDKMTNYICTLCMYCVRQVNFLGTYLRIVLMSGWIVFGTTT